MSETFDPEEAAFAAIRAEFAGQQAEIARLRAENADLQRKVYALRNTIRQLVSGQPDEADEG